MSFDENDIASLMDLEFDEEMETSYPLFLEGDFDGSIDKVELKGFPYTDKETEEEKVFTRFSAVILLGESDERYEEVKEAMGGMKPRIQYVFGIDRNEDGTVARGIGKNIKLGKLRASVNQNEKGVPWSFRQLEKQPLRFRIKHGTRKDDPQQPEATIRAVGVYGEDL